MVIDGAEVQVPLVLAVNEAGGEVILFAKRFDRRVVDPGFTIVSEAAKANDEREMFRAMLVVFLIVVIERFVQVCRRENQGDFHAAAEVLGVEINVH